ncbi:MAG TPA: TonB-dependent receptor [Allosphingosinicella sp.]|jgi:outer membrane receptor protein involved in Fe transport|nr:TonB-dependent receptor [Allosphingosinicella sp.]
MRKARLLGATAIVGLAAASVPAHAQDAQPTENSQQQAQSGSQPGNPPQPNAIDPQSEVQVQTGQPPEAGNGAAITVTGTRIRRPNLQSPVPITSVTAEELPNQGQASIGDALNDLPSLRSTFSQQNSGRFIGTAGLNELDLRGLGTSRTLVLVNGRRHVTAVPGQFIVDVNTIPQDLIERIDIVTGGESAVYGSDAIAGVVNFVLKRNFDGVRVRSQGGISSRGDRGIYFTSLTAGHNFAGGRGNVAINVEYTHAAPLYQYQRARYRAPCGFEPSEDPNVPDTGNGQPDNAYVCGIAVPGITAGGSIGLLSLDPAVSLSFDRGGNLVQAQADRSLLNFGGDVLTTNPLAGTPLNERDQLAVGQDRYTANILAHFDVSAAFKPFVEAKFVHQRVRQEGQPTFFQGRLATFFANNFGAAVPSLRCNNPFLSAQALTTLQSFGICTNVATGTLGVNRFNADFGGRGEIDKRDTYRIVGGVEGDFNGSWHYEISADYGHFKSNFAELNNLYFRDVNGNPAGFALAVDAVRNAAGQIVCRVNQVTVTVPACVPIDLFGEGAPSQAALDFVNTTSHLYSRASELDLLAFLSGDSSKFLNLPGGPVGFSLGAEYRRETAFRTADPLSLSGGTFFNIFPTFAPPAFSVKEVFGELNLPILKNVPLAHELTLSGAARYSDYSTAAGKTWAWNVNGIYSPISDLRLRANYSRSVRVPTLLDLYAPGSQNFAFLTDPCSQRNINNGGPNRAANCAALGVPTTILAGSPCIGVNGLKIGDPFLNCVAEGSPRSSIGVTSAGNPNLKAEIGKSLTVGGVLTPRFLPGFSLSVDYFNIKVTSLIAVLGAQTILDQCVDLPTLNNQFCQLLSPRTPFGLFQSPALISAGINFAKQTSRGIDFDLSYRHTFSNDNHLSVRGVATYTLERNNYLDPINPTLYTRQLSTLGDPVFSASLITALTHGPFTLQYTLRYIGTMTIFSYETTHSVQGNPPQDPDASSPARYPQVFYHDFRLETKVDNRFRFYLGVDNAFDKQPPFGLTGTGAGGAIYSNIGRYFYSGVQVDF